MTGFWVHSRCYRIKQKLQMMCNGVVRSIKFLQLDSCCLLPVLVLGRSWEANPGSGPDLSSRKRKTGCCAPWKVPPSWDQISHIPTHLLGVKLSPRRLFFEIETKYMPHINCQLWVLFTQRGGRYNVFQCLQRIVDYARSCFNARGASPHYCLRHCLWRFNQVAAASKRGETRQRRCGPPWGDNVAFKEAGQRLRLIRTTSFPGDQTFSQCI